ncbi:MAG TPA: response regulator [Fontimonas sp.]
MTAAPTSGQAVSDGADSGARAAIPIRSLLLCGVVLIASLALAWQTARVIERHQQVRFDYEVRRLSSAIEQRMIAYVQVLRGGRGMFEASDFVSRADWHTYVARLDVAQNYPGIRSMTFAKRVEPADLPAFIAAVRSEPIPPQMTNPAILSEYTLQAPPPPIVPTTPAVHAAVLYTEPLKPDSERALGIDMMRDAGRRLSMEAAVASDDAVLSPRLRILSPTGTQVGFIAYMPVQREGRQLGWLTGVFHAEEFMRGLLGANGSALAIEIFDSSTADAERLLYSTAGISADGEPLRLPADASSSFSTTQPLKMPGREWTVRFHAASDFATLTERTVPWLVALGGLLASLLLFVIGRASAQWQAQAAMLARQAVVLREARAAADSANEAKGNFLANMSHEIRTPLNAILGTAELLGDTRLDSDQRQSLETITQSGDHLLGVINDILDFTKVESGLLELDDEVFDLRRCIEEALELVAHRAAQKRIDLACDLAPGTPEMARGDMGRVRQVLVNYLGNAIKFTERGDVSVEVSAQPLGERRHRFRIAVRDTGIGIAADRLDRLFKTFSQVDASTTRRYGGSGLGLAISKRLAECMGGEVGVESHPGRGSTFWFTFCAETDPAWRPPQRPDAHALHGRRVLIVDDNDTNRRILSATVGEWGMQVVETHSARDALAMIERGERFDLAVLDYFMPEMDGVELATQIRRLPGAATLRMMLLSSARHPAGALEVFGLVRLKPLRRSALLDAMLDLLADNVAGDVVSLRDAPAPVPPLRILLVEDNAVNRQIALRMLDSLGYRADTAENGAEAVAAVQRQAYDLLLMDIHMPVLDGLEATRRIRALGAIEQPRIVAMSASVLDHERQACLDAGMDRHLGKPFRRHELESVLRYAALGIASAHSGEAGVAAALARLSADLGIDGALEVVDAMTQAAEDSLGRLQQALIAQDAAAAKRLTATLRSHCAMVGAIELGELWARLDRGDAGAATEAMTRYRALCRTLERWREDQSRR